MKRRIKRVLTLATLPLYDRARRVFCLSMQRTGTSSVGRFFRDFGFRWAGWPTSLRNQWSLAWYNGDYEAIFSSTDFRRTNAYEDSPWFCPGFYKILYHRFPEAKFVLFTRDPDDWFQSMMNHSRGNVLGRTDIHSKIYRRESEFLEMLNAGRIDETEEDDPHGKREMKLWGHEAHYKSVYTLHNHEVVDYFGQHAPDALHVGTLEDADKWQKLGDFLRVPVPSHYESHENASAQ